MRSECWVDLEILDVHIYNEKDGDNRRCDEKKLDP
jgi:hypothetical protein